MPRDQISPLEEFRLTLCQRPAPNLTLTLARKHGLTIYDAAYLELAQRRGAILATFDAQLLKAAGKEGVTVSGPESTTAGSK